MFTFVFLMKFGKSSGIVTSDSLSGSFSLLLLPFHYVHAASRNGDSQIPLALLTLPQPFSFLFLALDHFNCLVFKVLLNKISFVLLPAQTFL